MFNFCAKRGEGKELALPHKIWIDTGDDKRSPAAFRGGLYASLDIAAPPFEVAVRQGCDDVATGFEEADDIAIGTIVADILR